ncbi:ATP-grasp domain-containing protein [Paragemmobacter aquarius]|nr:ATP-grasp domain-containing protein [Gemmobacter aquarius]
MEEVSRWTPFSDEGVSGALLGVAAGLDLICHQAACLPVTKSAISDCGLKLPDSVLPYTTRGEYLDHMAACISTGKTAVTTFPTPDGLFDDSAYLVAPRIQCWLNQRGSLPALVPAENVPPRRLVEGAGLIDSALKSLRLPAVVKAADSAGTSGGAGVAIARAARHRKRARHRFADCSAIIIEDFIPARTNICVQVAVLPDASVQLIGASAQICSPGGLYLGSVAGPDIRQPSGSSALALTIAARAAALGFRGIAGFDILENADGQLFAIDLNFRPNGSTPLLLVLAGCGGARGFAHARFVLCTSADRLDQVLSRLGADFSAGWLVLTGAFDDKSAPARLRLVVLGESPQQLTLRLRQLERKGLCILAPRRTPLVKVRDWVTALYRDRVTP